MSEERGFDYYRLSEASKPQGGIATAATIHCCICGGWISGMGGGGNDAICMPCGDDMVRGKLRKFLDVRAMVAARK